VIELDGPSLRSLRQHAGVPLRKVARLAGMSHGHLSKVERAETGRPVTPAVLAAYEKATRILLATGHGDLDVHGWRPGRLGELELTRTEFALLELLMRNAGVVLSREAIRERVWGFDDSCGSNTLDVYVGYLRRKTGAGGGARMIHTVRGVGFVLRGQ
jgi:two-component system response regulator MprA